MRLFRKHLTPLACANSGAYSLSALRRIHNEDSVIMMLVAWISNLQRFLNVSAKMDAAQMYETCRMILDDFWALNCADVHLVMLRAKQGFFGQLFGRIDGQIIYSGSLSTSKRDARHAPAGRFTSLRSMNRK